MVVAAFNQEKALVGAFSVITNLRMELFQALVWWASCWSPPGTAHAAQAVPAPRVGGDHVAALARVHGVALGPGHVATRGPRHQQQHAWVPGHVTFFSTFRKLLSTGIDAGVLCAHILDT